MTRRREKLLQMIDFRMRQLIEEEEYEMCARIRDWRTEILAASYEQEKEKETSNKEIKICINRNSTPIQ